MSGRIRSIKPEVLEDEIASSLSDSAWRLWVSSWLLADDHGNFRAGSRYLAASVWQNTSMDVIPPLCELISSGLIMVYSANGQRYGHISGWIKHQRIDNAGKPRVPTPNDTNSTRDQTLTARFAESLGDSRQSSESLGKLPLDHDHDHRPTTAISMSPLGTDGGEAQAAEDPVTGIHSHYLAAKKLHNPKSRSVGIKPKDRKAIQAELKRGLSTDDLKLAIDGLFLSTFHLGENDRSTTYLDLSYALRSPEKFIALAEANRPTPGFIDGLPIIRAADRDDPKYWGHDLPDMSEAQ